MPLIAPMVSGSTRQAGRGFLGRHPVLAFVVSPLPVFLVFWICYLVLVGLLIDALDGDTRQPRQESSASCLRLLDSFRPLSWPVGFVLSPFVATVVGAGTCPVACYWPCWQACR